MYIYIPPARFIHTGSRGSTVKARAREREKGVVEPEEPKSLRRERERENGDITSIRPAPSRMRFSGEENRADWRELTCKDCEMLWVLGGRYGFLVLEAF